MRWIVVALTIWVGGSGSVLAREVFECEPLKGKGVEIRRETPEWFEDSLGPAQVLIEGEKFFVSTGDYIPPALAKLDTGKINFVEAMVASSDNHHIIAQISTRNMTRIFNFHLPTRILIRTSTHINNFSWPDQPFRPAYAHIFISRCK